MNRVQGDSRLQTEVLEELSDAHRYRRWLADLARPYLGQHPLEIGSGTGDYALEWLPGVQSFTATEADEARYAALQRRFHDHPVVRTQWLLLGDGQPAPNPAAPRHTAAVSFNVFEHIPDDVAALRSLHGLLEPDAPVVLIVPAFPSAMSRFDRRIGHQRRYTRASLARVMEQAGLRVQELRYINPLGLLSWYVAVKALNMTPRNGLPLRAYDRLIVPAARVADRFRSPFGQAVFAVGRTPG